MSTSPAPQSAMTPEEIHAIIESAINAADVDAYVDVHDADARAVAGHDGRTAHGRDEIRAAIAPLLEMKPRITTAVVKTLQTRGLALTHNRWRLTVTEAGCTSELSGLGTTVSRRQPDGSWRIVFDDPLTGR